MLQLSSDLSFHYEMLRVLAATATQGSDVGELLQVFPSIIPGDFESWYSTFYHLAHNVVDSVSDPAKEYDEVSLRVAYLRASHYLFAADFYLHGRHDDPRIAEVYKEWTTFFDKALALFPYPAERTSLDAEEFSVPLVIIQPDTSSEPKPTLILGNGFDGSMEEMIHVLGFPALERGYNVVLYEGPGQTGVRRTQNIGFIHDWERVVTPVVDHLLKLSFVDPSRISLLGYSLGGYFAGRAAAFEHRLAACMLIDGVWDYGERVMHNFPQAFQHFQEGDAEACNKSLEKESQTSTTMRWAYEHFVWAMKRTGFEGIQVALKMNLRDIAHQIRCPTFVGEAIHDQFFPGQPQEVKNAIGEHAYLFSPGRKTAATAHCHVGATFYFAQEVFAWLKDKRLE